MPGHTVHLVVRRDHHPKYQEPAYWADQSNRVHIDIMIHVIVNHNHLYTISLKGRVDGKHSSIIFACKCTLFVFLTRKIAHSMLIEKHNMTT